MSYYRTTKVILTTLIIGWAVVTLYFFFTNPAVRLGVLICMLKRMYQLGLLSSIIFLSAGIGMWIIKLPLHPTHPSDGYPAPPLRGEEIERGGKRDNGSGGTWLYSIGIGLGFLSYITLLLGLLGIMERWVYLLIMGILIIFTRRELWKFGQYIYTMYRDFKIEILPPNARGQNDRIKCHSERSEESNSILIFLLALSVILNLIGAFTPDVHYDALEYHFGAPSEFLKDGRIHFLKHNVYSNFPSLVEMLYLLGMLIEGDTLAKLFHWAFGILTGMAIFSFGKKLFGTKAGLVGMVIFYIFGQITILSTQALIDMGLAFYSFLGLMAIIEWIMTGDRKWFLLSAISMGLAVSCKYTALLSFLAIGLLILFHEIRHIYLSSDVCLPNPPLPPNPPLSPPLLKGGKGGFGGKAGFNCLLFAFLVFLGSSPWFIKNLIWTRNPVYPLCYNIFDGKNWDKVKDERFYKAHAPGRKDPVTLVRTLIDMTFKDQFMTPLFLLLMPIGIFLKDIPKPIRYLLIYLALFYLFWFYWTHRIDRFFLPAIPVMALVSGYVYTRLIEAKILEKPLSIILIFSLLFNLYISAFTLSSINPFAYAFGFETKDEFLVRTLPPYPAMKFINENLDDDAVILLIGEAEVHYINRKVLYNTVFDASIIDDVVNISSSPEEVYEKIKGLGATHILLNYVEVSRLNRTYSYMKDFNWDLFYGFEKKYLEKLYSLEDKVLVYKVK